jgi:hypothetical protein
MYVCVRGGPIRPLHRDPQWSIVLPLSLVIPSAIPHFGYSSGFYAWGRRDSHLVPWNIDPGDEILSKLESHIYTGYVWLFHLLSDTCHKWDCCLVPVEELVARKPKCQRWMLTTEIWKQSKITLNIHLIILLSALKRKRKCQKGPQEPLLDYWNYNFRKLQLCTFCSHVIHKLNLISLTGIFSRSLWQIWSLTDISFPD